MGRSGRNRTLIYGFGDHHSTIELHSFVVHIIMFIYAVKKYRAD